MATSIKDVFVAAIAAFNADKVPRLAAALAYYIAFSIAPLMIVIVTVINYLISMHPGAGSEHAVRAELVEHLSGALGADGARAVNAFMTASSSQHATGVVATVVSWVFIVLGATGLFGALQDALNTIFEAPASKQGFLTALRDRLVSLVMVLFVTLLLAFSTFAQDEVQVAGRALSILPSTSPIVIFAAAAVGWALSAFSLVVLFAILYRILPDVRLPMNSVVRGAAITAALFLVGEFAINLYLQHVATSSTYGALGSLVILLLWLNYSMQTVLFGAELTKVLDRRDAAPEALATEAVPELA